MKLTQGVLFLMLTSVHILRVHSDYVSLLRISECVGFLHIPDRFVINVKHVNPIVCSKRTSLSVPLIIIIFIKFEFTQITQVLAEYFKSFGLVKSTPDEKVRCI